MGVWDQHMKLPLLPCLPQVPVWVLQQDATGAHNSRLTAFAGCGTTVATGSAVGGVKVRGVQAQPEGQCYLSLLCPPLTSTLHTVHPLHSPATPEPQQLPRPRQVWDISAMRAQAAARGMAFPLLAPTTSLGFGHQVGMGQVHTPGVGHEYPSAAPPAAAGCRFLQLYQQPPCPPTHLAALPLPVRAGSTREHFPHCRGLRQSP